MTKLDRFRLCEWIGIHVMGWHCNDARLNSFNPTDESKDAMDVLKKCAENTRTIVIQNIRNVFTIRAVDSIVAESETLELAICLFAKQLFSQTTK